MEYNIGKRVVYKYNNEYLTGVIFSYNEDTKNYYLLPDKNNFDFKIFVSEKDVIGISKVKAYKAISENRLSDFL